MLSDLEKTRSLVSMHKHFWKQPYQTEVSRTANAHGDGDGDEDGMLTRPNNQAMITLPVLAENRFSN